MEVFSTQGVAAPQKAERWNAMLSGLGDTLRVWPRDPLRFDGTLIRQRIGRLTLFEISCGSVRVQHERRQISRTQRSSYQVLMPVQGEFSLSHGEQSCATVDVGSFCLIDRAQPYEMVHGDGLRAIGVELPRTLLESCLPQATRHAGAILRPSSGPTRVLGGLLRTLGTELSGGATDALPSSLARAIAGFVAAAFAETGGTIRRKGVKARLAAYREFVDMRLRDADFRLADVAREFHVSERYVRGVFQSAGEPLSDYLLRRRLELAAVLLRSSEYAEQTVMHVALECGFNGASQFGHSFRHHFGMTPREYRRAGAGFWSPRVAG